VTPIASAPRFRQFPGHGDAGKTVAVDIHNMVRANGDDDMRPASRYFAEDF